MQKDNGEHRDKHKTELVDRGNLGSISYLEGAKIAHPGSACCEARKAKE